jgi:hypothetical protein
MLKFLEHGIADQRVLRPVRKSIVAGVSENGARSDMEDETVHGPSVSPLQTASLLPNRGGPGTIMRGCLRWPHRNVLLEPRVVSG